MKTIIDMEPNMGFACGNCPLRRNGDEVELVLGRERFWAVALPNGVYEVANVLIGGLTTQGDVVEANEAGQVTAVIERRAVTHMFAVTKEEGVASLGAALEALDVPYERISDDTVGAALPIQGRFDGTDTADQKFRQKELARSMGLRSAYDDEQGWHHLYPLLVDEE